MSDDAPAPDPLTKQLKRFIVDYLELRDLKADEITDLEPLLGGKVGLDPVDAVELAMGLEEKMGIAIRSENEFRAAFANVASLAAFVRNYVPARSVPSEPLVSFGLMGR